MVLGMGFGSSYRTILHEFCADPEGRKEKFITQQLEASASVSAIEQEEKTILNRALNTSHLLVHCQWITSSKDQRPYPLIRPMDILARFIHLNSDEVDSRSHLHVSLAVIMIEHLVDH